MAGRRRSDRALRGKLRSPGRPPVARQAHRRRFWVFIAEGLSSEDAAMQVGVSQPGRGPMVSRGGWYGAIAPVAVVGAAVWAPSLICRAGGDRAVASAGFGRTRGRTPAGAGGIDGIA